MDPLRKGYTRGRPADPKRDPAANSAWALVWWVTGIVVVGVISVSVLLAFTQPAPLFRPVIPEGYTSYLAPMQQLVANTSAPPIITFIEDFQCPSCMSFHFFVEPHLLNLSAQFPALRFQWVYVSYIDTFGGLANNESLLLAEGYHCANDLGFGHLYKKWVFDFQLDTYSGSLSGSASDDASTMSQTEQDQLALSAFPRTTLERCPAPAGGNGTMTCKSPDRPPPLRCVGKRSAGAAQPYVQENGMFWNVTTVTQLAARAGSEKAEFFERCLIQGTHRIRVLRDTQVAMASQDILTSGIPFVTVNAAPFCDDPGELADVLSFATDTITGWSGYTDGLFVCPLPPLGNCGS